MTVGYWKWEDSQEARLLLIGRQTKAMECEGIFSTIYVITFEETAVSTANPFIKY